MGLFHMDSGTVSAVIWLLGATIAVILWVVKVELRLQEKTAISKVHEKDLRDQERVVDGLQKELTDFRVLVLTKLTEITTQIHLTTEYAKQAKDSVENMRVPNESNTQFKSQS